MAGAWIFQGNPRYYDVAGAVRALPSIAWVVRQYKRQIEAGDTAYIWETGGTGVVARAIVTGDPVLAFDQTDAFTRQFDGVTAPELFAPLTIVEVFDPPLSRAECRADPVLETLRNLAFPNATNYPLMPEQEAAIKALLGEPRRAAEPPPTDRYRLAFLAGAIEAWREANGSEPSEGVLERILTRYPGDPAETINVSTLRERCEMTSRLEM